MIEVGYFSLCFALLLCCYSLLTSFYSFFNPKLGVVISARNSLIAVFFCVFLSSLVLWNAILFHDFSVQYVFLHSAVDTPLLYLITSFWSALEGSHLLWTLLMSIVVSIALITVKKEHFSLYPSLIFVFALSLTFMIFLCVTYSAPLTRLFPVGKFGQGMNALLQNKYMAIHPPMLFTAYSLLIVPFAYSFAILIRGNLTRDYLAVVRRWMLLAWALLSIAIFLGGKWAYVVLGWAGYWAWDPVENSSFMPWIALTSAIHTLIIHDKTGRLPRLLLFLNMFAYILTFQGTFITRSGIISSVHSFAESSIGPAYLIWILFLLIFSIFVLLKRGSLLEGASEVNEWKFSKESALLFTNFFLLFLLALVFIGTLLPLIVEAIGGVRISVQQPFFNAFAPWIGIGLVSLLGIGNLLSWKNGKIEDPISCLLFPALWSIMITFCLFIKQNLDLKSVFCFFLVIWTSCVLLMDFIYKLKRIRWNGILFLKYNRPFIGALIIHLGFLIAVAGFSGNYRGLSATANLKLNETTLFQGYIIKNQGLTYKQEDNAQYIIANLKASDLFSNNSFQINPMRSKFTNNEQWFNEIGIHSTFWSDLYVVLASFDMNTQNISLKINWNPTVKLVWTSLVVMILGVFITLSHHLQKRSLDIENKESLLNETITKNKSRVVGMGLLFLILGIVLFGFSGVVYAQQNVVPSKINPKIESIAKELRCPTCQGVSVLESETPQSVAMRIEIENQVVSGKTKQEVLNYFKERYGPWILREPDVTSSLGLLLWLIPSIVLVGGPLFLFFTIKTSRARKLKKDQELVEALREYIEKNKNGVRPC